MIPVIIIFVLIAIWTGVTCFIFDDFNKKDILDFNELSTKSNIPVVVLKAWLYVKMLKRFPHYVKLFFITLKKEDK